MEWITDKQTPRNNYVNKLIYKSSYLKGCFMRTKYDSIPEHDVVLCGSSAHSGRGILLSRRKCNYQVNCQVQTLKPKAPLCTSTTKVSKLKDESELIPSIQFFTQTKTELRLSFAYQFHILSLDNWLTDLQPLEVPHQSPPSCCGHFSRKLFQIYLGLLFWNKSNLIVTLIYVVSGQIVL